MIFLFIPTNSIKFLLILQTVAAAQHVYNGINFNRNTTGVVFAPFAKQLENQVTPGFDQYNLKEIETMYEVVADKFQMTATYGVGSNKEEKYEYNVSYHHTREKSVLCAEAASLVNKRRNKKAVTVLIGVYRRPNSPEHMYAETELAFESAEIANRNYPGTATGLIFTSSDFGTNVHSITETLELISTNKQRAHKMGLIVGTRQDCELLKNETGNLTEPAARFQEIIKESDFIICDISPEGQNLSGGVEAVMAEAKTKVLEFRNRAKYLNPEIDLMFQTGWPSGGSSEWHNIENLVKYWKLVNDWAKEENIKVWILEAFDNPWKQWNAEVAHFGWWKIIKNRDAGIKEGYVEKIFAKSEKLDDSTNVWVYIGSVSGGLIFCILVGTIFWLYYRVNKLEEILTKDDIRQFVYGVSNENASLLSSENGEIEPALRIPYDKEKFEIPKNKIDIKRDKMLGSGQFGYVYKANVQMENNDESEVALKTAKPECPKEALKSLLSEIKILTYLGKHTNVVCIVGAYTAELEKGIVYVATEICSLGSLEGFLRNETVMGEMTDSRYANGPIVAIKDDGSVVYSNERSIKLIDMITWAHEIACGMEYLGTKNVVHADLATRNVLLTSEKTAKITDFGLSRRLYDYTNYVKKQQEPLPWRWMAIESLKRLQFSSQSDVWSYGVTLWEIFSLGDVPFPGLNWNLEFVNDLENGLRMMSPKYASPKIYQLMSQCWKEDRNERPTFTALKTITSELITRRDLAKDGIYVLVS